MSKKATWLDRMKLKTKMRVPSGMRLSTGETIALAEVYREDARKIADNKQEVSKALNATEVSYKLKGGLDDARGAKSAAIATFKRTKDPVKRREWARRVVVADSTIKSLSGMKKRMTATHDRLVMIKGDLELQMVEAQAKAAEAEAYVSAGQQLRLVGDKLIDARTRAKKLKMEYANLEITMEGAERSISNADPEELLKQAEAIVGTKVAGVGSDNEG